MTQILTRSIRAKLLVITGLGTLLVLTASLFGIYQGWQSIAGFDRLMRQEVENLNAVLRLDSGLRDQALQWNSMLILGADETSRMSYWDAYTFAQEMLEQDVAELIPKVQEPVAREELEMFLVDYRDLLQLHEEARQVYIDSDFDPAAPAHLVGRPVADVLGRLGAASIKLSDIALAKTEQTVESTRKMIQLSLAGLGVAVLIGIVLVLALIERGIIRPTRRLVEDLERMAEGDFTTPVQPLGHDELGRLAVSAGRIKSQLGEALQQVAAAVARLGTAADSLSAVSEETGLGVRQQRAESEQVATAMQQISATVQEMARNAGDAAGAAGQADAAAGEGRAVVDRSVRGVEGVAADLDQAAAVFQRLEEDSLAVRNVLEVINSVAEQTNLLALNAAIEAARAGEHGRVFAVVADEVRVLALRTRESTLEIQNTVERIQDGTANASEAMQNSRSRARDAVDEARQAGAALEAIIGAVATIRDMNAQIASATEEQSAVVEEISRSATSISEIGERSAAGADRTIRSTEELTHLADELHALVGRIKLTGTASPQPNTSAEAQPAAESRAPAEAFSLYP